MSTHNIGVYEDLKKNIIQLSSNTQLISSSVIYFFVYFSRQLIISWHNNEPSHEKPCFLHTRKQMRRSALLFLLHRLYNPSIS